ncbi:MAG: penicillin-binding transpeptidase domain-containing protein [Sporolactobacillus sp.]|uniref:penicillin-binding transpeptidase domain-containing protein n=1 Tax=Sporolactobacillus sp. STSJ-5 TaxID=2965076 RepID=UPI0021079100|nr:penicillin-binding transpeptidase domain-containing protein [Sporolactobacillus sp. STSJ-5]MCQ2008864.1 penicillin-binding transpeptidase domain-containing protein [Sporolactobacillus sp. STSJ-5]
MFQRKRRLISFWAGIVGGLFMLAFFVIIGRFVFIAQGKEIDNHQLLKVGEKQWSQYKTVDEKRGTIYSDNGRILAEDVPAYTLYAIISPKSDNHVKDKKKTAAALAPILEMKESDILKELNRNVYQVEFGSKGKMLSYAKKKQIDRLNLPGIGYLTESKRYYPEQSSAAYTLGFTQTNQENNQQKGVFGVEQSLDKYLTEKDGSVRYYRSLSGVPIPDEKQKIKKASPGKDVYLTLNTRIQTVLDQAMSRVNEDYSPESMIGIAADPKTGKILAISSYPTFNPNKRDIKNFSNTSISEPYEPGSVMKVFTVASAIDAGVYKGSDTYQSGDYKTSGGTIHDWRRQGWGTITFDQGFELSSNVGMSVLTDKYLGVDRFKNYLKKFGLMDKTGIDLPGERSSVVNWQWKIDKLEASFGQASAFTAMQIVQAATAIGNDGKMMRPYIVDKIVNPATKKTILKHQPVVAGNPISASAAEQTRALMRKVVTEKKVVNGYSATGLAYDLPGYDVIGKTGTAQISLNGQYMVGKNNYVYSFLGMAPQKDPKLIVYVAVKQPHLKATDLGAEPVVDIVRPVMTSALQYLQVDKKASESKEKLQLPSQKFGDYTGTDMNETVEKLKGQGIVPISIGSGTIQKQLPYAGERLYSGNKVILSGEGQKTMPDLTGWTLADTMKLADMENLKLSAKGEGFVTGQSIAAGAVIKSGSDLIITMQAEKTEKTNSNTGNSSPDTKNP